MHMKKAHHLHKMIALLVIGIGVAITPFILFAVGTPTFSLLGAQSIKSNEASISVAYDSNGATYVWEQQPKISIVYTNLANNQSNSSITIGQAQGSRTAVFVLRNLVPGTTYAYRAVMTYNGMTYSTQPLNFKTLEATTIKLNTGQQVPVGNPTFSLSGVQNLSHSEATIQVAYDSRNAQYQWENQPKISISYTDLSDGTVYTSLAIGQSTGSRTTAIALRDLKPNTKYSYKAVMTYAGNRYESESKTFTTKPYTTIGLFDSGSSTSTSSNGLNIFVNGGTNTGGGATITKSIGADKVASNLESIIKTGGYGTKNGVSLAITDTHARVVEGSTFEYTIQYHNDNNKTLRTARVVVQLPSQYEFESGDDNTVYSNDNNVVTIYIGSIQPYESGTIRFKARAIGGESGGVETKAMLVYTGGSVSATDRDTFAGGSQGVLGATVFGSGFFPQTFFGWLVIIIVLIIIMIVARRYMTPVVPPKIEENK